MTRRRFPTGAPALAILLSFLSFSVAVAAAAEAPTSSRVSAQRWEEMVVVASHVPRPVREVGSAISVLTAEDVEMRKVALGSELLREVPGLAVNRGGAVGTITQVRIRGAEGNHTLVLIDGIEANDPALSNEFNFGDLLTWDIDRVEVLRGPQSALFGSDSIGGVVSIRTEDPQPGFGLTGEAETGSFGTTRFGATISGGSERARGLFSAARYDTDGISSSDIQPERDGYENTTLHGKLDLELDERLGMQLVVRRADNAVENDRQDFNFPDTPTQGLVVDADARTESSQLYGLVQLDAGLADGRWRHRVAYAYTDTESDSYDAGAPTAGSRGERRKLEYETTLLLGGHHVRHALTGGIQREDLRFENISASLPGANQGQEDDQTSFVAEYSLSFGDRGAISLSARRDDNDRFDDATTYRVSGSYLLESSQSRVHASYGEGIANPNFFELFGFFPDSYVGNPDLQPERSDSWDVGVEQSLFDGRALLDVTYFDATLTDEIVTVFLPTFQSTSVNQKGESDREGVEVTADARLGERWSVSGTYTYVDATDPDGLIEVRRPRHSGSVNLNYALNAGRGHVNVGALFNGEQEDSEFVNATPATRVTLDGYTLVNAAVVLNVTDSVQLFLRGENLLDEDYSQIFGYRSPGVAGYLGVRARL